MLIVIAVMNMTSGMLDVSTERIMRIGHISFGYVAMGYQCSYLLFTQYLIANHAQKVAIRV
ncbi:hypothetical protein [Yersinia hibernica]|uniref:hypothetical protein n=1 Tax=Yersinia hibernica TaxID=2339259 RepID=UPI00138FE53D|nr:hypothetical protein [Yersinia hibernica]